MFRPSVLTPVLLAAALLGGGCATRGPNHVYVTTAGAPEIRDLGPAGTAALRALGADEQVLGLAYDFNTDHLFLRIAPAQVIRVIERPSGKVLREMPLPAGLRATAPADLAIRSRDRHLFAVHPDGRSIVELTLFGEPLRQLNLSDLGGPIGGLACDQREGRLLVLVATAPARVATVGADGTVDASVTLAEPVAPVSLGFNSEDRRFFVPLADGHTLGEFDAEGRLVARHALPGGAPITGLDAGQRSFVRVF